MALLPASAQILNLPPRPANALTGTQFTNIISSLSQSEREQWIYAQIIGGNVPNWLRNLKPITVNAGGNTATYQVTPDYLSIGSDTNYFRAPMTPLLAQRLADRLGYSLPTRKMVNQIWTNAAIKLTPTTIPWSAEMVTVPVFAWHNYMVQTNRDAYTNAHPLGTLVGGTKKDVIISARIYTNFATASITETVVIYGWHYTSGAPIQPLYNGHEETYADYSHGIRFVQQNLTVNGGGHTITNVLTSASLCSLLSDDGASEGSTNGTIPVPRYTIAPLKPTVMTHPVSQSVLPGANLTLSTLAIGDDPLRYQWRLNGVNLASATNATLSLTNLAAANAGSYSVIVTNAAGAATSRVAVVRVKTSDFPVLFSADFDTNSAANWNIFWGAANPTSDYRVDFAFDYGVIPYTFNGVTALIPPAPNSLDGSTRGVRLAVNRDATATNAAVNLYPKNFSASGNFALKFDLWINYPGNAGGTGTGVTGSTQHGMFGINHLGTNVNWAATTASASDGLWFALDGEGGDSRDYRASVGNLAGTQIELLDNSGLSASTTPLICIRRCFPPHALKPAVRPARTGWKLNCVRPITSSSGSWTARSSRNVPTPPPLPAARSCSV
ncbi:MAG: immunoglobulin domain-containing protein [Verrucomicrobiota bacterium]